MEKKTYFEILQKVENEELRHKILHNTLQDNNCRVSLKGKFSGLTNLLNCSFVWHKTEEGHEFWENVAKNHSSEKISIFYLLKKVKESKLQYEILENIISQRSSSFDKLYYKDVPDMILEGFVWTDSKQGHSYWKEVYESFLPPERDDTEVSPEEQKSIISILEIISKM